MESNQFEEIINRHVFDEAKLHLIRSIAKNSDRFVGIFRSTTPKLKLMQNLLQSREIRFGDAMEKVISSLLQEMGHVILSKSSAAEEEEMSYDHYFCNNDNTKFYLVEQKMRDDHDSSKKRGQFDNFRNKIIRLRTLHGEALTGIMYFIDPSSDKNKNYYRSNIDMLTEALGVDAYLFYNSELFDYFSRADLWDQLVTLLRSWREKLGGELDLNFDRDPEASVNDLVEVNADTWRRILGNNLLWSEGVTATLFPDGRTLQLQQEIFHKYSDDMNLQRSDRIKFAQLAIMLQERLNQYYPH